MNWSVIGTRRLGLVAGVMLAVLVLGWQLTGLLAQADEAEPSALGQELIRQLGLEPEADGVLVGCEYASEVQGKLYCLDEQASSGREFHMLAMRLRGHEPTEKDLELLDLHVLVDRLEYEAPSDPAAMAQLQEVLDRMDALIAEGATLSGT